MNRIHLNCLHTTSSIPPYPLNPSISSSNKNNSNIPTFSPIISVVNSNMLSTNDEMDSSLNNVHKYYDNTAFIHNPCMKSDSVVYLTTCSSQSLPTATPIHISEISKPPAIHTSFMPLEILTNHSSENTVITPSISSSPSILSAVCDSILSHIPLSVVNKTSLGRLPAVLIFCCLNVLSLQCS
ncbi:unnamed protein product [Heterobilharzia americana]|nr:unnamed protein product [Heterobilharzia americana]